MEICIEFSERKQTVTNLSGFRELENFESFRQKTWSNEMEICIDWSDSTKMVMNLLGLCKFENFESIRQEIRQIGTHYCLN